jgi:hypothetical protein
MILKFKLTQNEMIILYQNSDYFNRYFRFASRTGWIILVSSHPQIYTLDKEIYLRGYSTDRDFEPLFSSPNKELYNSLLDTFADFCKQKKFNLIELNNNIYEIRRFVNE